MAGCSGAPDEPSPPPRAHFSGIHSDFRARQNHDDAFHGDDTRDAEWRHRAGLTQY
ncbi:MAG: hypothetical protein ABI112_10695 [Terracoccus sp.]